MGKPELARLGHAEGDIAGSSYDGHVAGTRRPRHHGGEEPDRSRADHHGKIAGPDPRPLDDVGNRVAGRLNERRLVEGHAVRTFVEQTFRVADVFRHCTVNSPAGRAFVRANLDIAGPAKIALAAGLRMRFGHHAIADL